MSEINTLYEVENDMLEILKKIIESLDLLNPKYILRADLTPEIRMSIAYEAIEAKKTKNGDYLKHIKSIRHLSIH